MKIKDVLLCVLGGDALTLSAGNDTDPGCKGGKDKDRAKSWAK